MSSQLNSILLEGTVTEKKVINKKHSLIVVYTLKNTSKGPTNSKPKDLSIDCYLHGELAKRSLDYVEEGMNVRALGRLVQKNGNIAIYGQHLEFRRRKKDVAIFEK